MPEKRFTAEQEIVTRIKALDVEESEWRRKAAKAEVEMKVAQDQAEQVSRERTKYQFALSAMKPALEKQPELVSTK